jgi:dTDP-4-amino-4,6-dideoxygalactose transaminase
LSQRIEVDIRSKPNPDFIPHSRPTLGAEEKKAVAAVIDSGHIAEGSAVKEFEDAFARWMGVNRAVATSSGTAALHLTLLAMDIGPDDEVIIPSYVCTALLNAVRYVGASPVLAEIDPVTYNIDPHDVKRRLSRHTKAIVVPHLFGLAADLDRLLELNVPIIEDCAQAVGAKLNGIPLGTFGDASIFSFFATKMMTCGEGGMVISNSEKLINRVADLKTYDEKERYETRFNYKMTDIQAAIGLAQLARLDSFILQRRAIATRYLKAFQSLGLKLPPDDPAHIYYRFVIGFETDSQPVVSKLVYNGIGCARPIYMPLHAYLKLTGYPLTDNAWQTSLSIPIYPSLSDQEMNRVIEVVGKE